MNRNTSTSSRRQGVFIVLVMVILAVFAIIGVVIYSAGSTEYNHTMLVAYKLKADSLGQAVIDEALCVLYDKLNRPVDIDISDDADAGRPEPPWKTELFQKIEEAAEDEDSSTEIGVLLSFDLVELGLLPETTQLLADQDCTIEECVIDFEGFRRLWSRKDGLFVKERDVVFYKDPKEQLDQDLPDGEYPYPNDYQGYAVIKVKVAYGSGRVKMSRHLSSMHDIKLVNQTPMAREFAVFQWYPVSDPTTQADDLNQGGGLKVFPNDSARLFVRGPYVADTYGKPDGTGGDDPDEGLSYWQGDWHGWSPIPSSRAGIMSARLWDQQSPMRPDSSGDTGLDLGFGGFNVQSDPGYTLGADQQWICASREANDANNYNAFSLIGDVGEIQTFEGILAKSEGDSESNLSPAPGGEWPPNPTDSLEDLWVKRIEGRGLHHRAHLVKFDQRKFTVGAFGIGVSYIEYSVDIENDNVIMPYGVYFMPNIEPEALGAWLSMACSMALGAAAVFGAGGFTEFITENAIAGITAQEFLNMTMMNMAIDSMVAGFNDSSQGSVGYNIDLTPEQMEGFFPPNYRDITRTASRWYYSMDDIPSYQQEDAEAFPIMLDGTILLHTMNDQRWFTYSGKGTIVSNNGAGDPARVNPVIEAPIMSLTPELDHLNLVYAGKQEEAHTGDDLLYIRGAADTTVDGEEVGTFLDASVFSAQGIAPGENTVSVSVGGNYICGMFNKSKTPEDTEVVVRYNTTYKPEEEDEINAFHDGRWHTASISFRTSGWYDRRRDEE